MHTDQGDEPCPDKELGHLRGTRVQLENGIIRFDSQLRHCTYPWTLVNW